MFTMVDQHSTAERKHCVKRSMAGDGETGLQDLSSLPQGEPPSQKQDICSNKEVHQTSLFPSFYRGDEDVGQQLRALVALPEDQSSVRRTHGWLTTIYNFSSRGSDFLIWPLHMPITQVEYSYTFRQNNYILYIK